MRLIRLDRYPESVLADYANFAIGKSLSTTFTDYSVGRTRPSDCPEALARLGSVRPGALPAYLEAQRHLAEASCHIRMNDRRQALAELDLAKATIADRSELVVLNEQVARLEDVVRQMQ